MFFRYIVALIVLVMVGLGTAQASLGDILRHAAKDQNWPAMVDFWEKNGKIVDGTIAVGDVFDIPCAIESWAQVCVDRPSLIAKLQGENPSLRRERIKVTELKQIFARGVNYTPLGVQPVAATRAAGDTPAVASAASAPTSIVASPAPAERSDTSPGVNAPAADATAVAAAAFAAEARKLRDQHAVMSREATRLVGATERAATATQAAAASAAMSSEVAARAATEATAGLASTNSRVSAIDQSLQGHKGDMTSAFSNVWQAIGGLAVALVVAGILVVLALQQKASKKEVSVIKTDVAGLKEAVKEQQNLGPEVILFDLPYYNGGKEELNVQLAAITNDGDAITIPVESEGRSSTVVAVKAAAGEAGWYIIRGISSQPSSRPVKDVAARIARAVREGHVLWEEQTVAFTPLRSAA